MLLINKHIRITKKTRARIVFIAFMNHTSFWTDTLT
jgi:hypothetical protein